MRALDIDSLGEFTADELGMLEVIWPGGVRVKLTDRFVYEVWCTGFGPAMTFTKSGNGHFVVTDLVGEFMTGGTNLQDVVCAVLVILDLDFQVSVVETDPPSGNKLPQGREAPLCQSGPHSGRHCRRH